MIELGVKQVADQLHEALLRYIEAQYHVRDTDVIEERRALLRESGTIGQEPYLETTPAYELSSEYTKLGLPTPVGETLATFAAFGDVGIFPRPYVHQAQALQAFFGPEMWDLIVATGTGSGKTETFLMPILGQLLREGHERPLSWGRQGIRAIILYPMNALVSDQLTRLRRLIGDPRVAAHFQSQYGRHPRFGMYTSRTPYPGVRRSARDQAQIEPVLRYYLELERSAPGLSKAARERNARLVRELKARGRWPAKDLSAFYGEPGQRWDTRLVTAEGDRELMTRHEMQRICPDVLVTNYSMLEYMLLRPIERSLFRKTRTWLAEDPRNQLVLVLDEAHMYRGVGGAEVSLLIRRLQARLGIPRDRLRCILTSASLGDDAKAEADGHRFAIGLTGARQEGDSPFRLIRGTKADRQDASVGTRELAERLASLDLPSFFRRADDLGAAHHAIAALADRLGWPAPPAPAAQRDPIAMGEVGASESGNAVTAADVPLRRYLFEQLGTLPPMNLLINATAGHARAFSDLTRMLFPRVGRETAELATTTLLALGTYANEKGRPLMPARAHLFFRGLPTLYACVDRHCTARRHNRPDGGPYTLGRLYTEPRTHCDCQSKARVFEVFAHRDCGAVFLRVFGRGQSPDFYWHERGGTVDPHSAPFDESLLILEEPHEKMTAPQKERVEPIWIELTTGRVLTLPPAGPDAETQYRACWRPRANAAQPIHRAGRTSGGRKARGAAAKDQQSGDALGLGIDPATKGKGPLASCPNCTRGTGYKIMDLATKGEQPFANLVREQLILQPAVRSIDAQFPNGGRKVLLFSDGRQKAARLARDLPREVEFDSFRQALALSIRRLEQVGARVALDERLYQAFVSVCHDFHLHFFDQEGNAQPQLLKDIEQFRTRYDADLPTLLEEGRGMRPPFRFRQALLRQLADPFYSLYSACVAVVEPTDRAIRDLRRRLAEFGEPFPEPFLREQLLPYSAAWIQELLDKGAFDPDIPESARYQVNEYFKPWEPGRKVAKLENLLAHAGGLSAAQIDFLREQLYDVLTRKDEKKNPYLSPAEVRLRLAIDDPWYQCRACGLTQHAALYDRCAECESKRLVSCAPDDPYMTSRNDYIRQPLRAVLAGARPVHVTAEEHTAQLSQRDRGVVYATTEEYELRFQDVLIDVDKPPVDVLSCTTTMEVGIDIGSLTAVGLRNVPPQRENYQQRAGRSGRRGSAVSTVITYAQDGPHDYHYYSHPAAIISGAPREPKLKIDNPRLAARHIHSHLIQTFFHQTLDALGQVDEEAIAESRTSIMSAFGEARAFFTESGDFSLPAFKAWVAAEVLEPGAALAPEVAAWLPEELSPAATPAERRADKLAFVVREARAFVCKLEEIARSYTAPPPAAVGDPMPGLDDDEGMLLNALFDSGLLPSYAFPTDLAPFYVFAYDRERGRHGVKEKPQQGKDKALSEYAPGRLLVIDKQTYRVGGIYTEDGRVLNPGEAIFAHARPVYVFCPQCTYVEVREPNKRHHAGLEAHLCPVCQGGLEERELVDPPAFVPERGEALRERDRSQEISYATEAQFPTPTRPTDLDWKAGPWPHLRYAYQENQELVIANKGPKTQGFRICQTCGATWPEADTPVNGRHVRPYPITQQHRQAGISRDCTGLITSEPMYLGFKFRTDILLLQLALHRPLAYAAGDPWLHDALRTTAEALTLAAGRRLDIDPGELAAGYRLMPPTPATPGALAAVEIYLYDTAAGGAGYAAEAGEHLGAILDEALTLVRSCPEGCERSCTKCLRHYGNRLWHDRMDRHLAEQMIRYATEGTAPGLATPRAQAETLVGLARYLELEGWTVERPTTDGRGEAPLAIEQAGYRAVIGTYPALLDVDAIGTDQPAYRAAASPGPEARAIVLNDYVVTRDLPTAYQMLRRHMHA